MWILEFEFLGNHLVAVFHTMPHGNPDWGGHIPPYHWKSAVLLRGRWKKWAAESSCFKRFKGAGSWSSSIALFIVIIWLVVKSPPLKNMKSSVGITIPNWMEKTKNVPNHQPVVLMMMAMMMTRTRRRRRRWRRRTMTMMENGTGRRIYWIDVNRTSSH